MSEIYDIGDRPTITFEFRALGTESDEAPDVDPDAIVFKLKSPKGVTWTAAKADATRTALGTFAWYLPTAFTSHGDWYAKATATNPDTAIELMLQVRRSNIP